MNNRCGYCLDGPMRGQMYAARTPDFKVTVRTLVRVQDWRSYDSAELQTVQYIWSDDQGGWIIG